MIANRRRPGTTSRKSSSRLPARSVCLDRQSSDVAARPRQTCDQAAADRVDRQCKDDGDDRCRLLYCGDGGFRRDDDVDLQPDELGRDLGVALGAALRPAILDRDGAALDPAEFAQSLPQKRPSMDSRPKRAAPRNPMVGSLPDCCARAASGHAAAAPPSSVMNSRRLIGSSSSRGPYPTHY